MPVPRGIACNLTYTAFDYVNNVGKVGDGPNHTLRLVSDGVERTPVNSPVEIDSTNLPGQYGLSLLAYEMDADLIFLSGKSSTVGISIVPTQVTTD